MAIWIKNPDPDGNCCDCNVRAGPCDPCEEEPCSCSAGIPGDYSNLEALRDARDEFFSANLVSATTYITTPTTRLDSLTASSSANSLNYTFSCSSTIGEVGAFVGLVCNFSINLTAGAVLTMSFSSAGSIPENPGYANFVYIYPCSDDEPTGFQQSDISPGNRDASGSWTYNVPTTGEYNIETLSFSQVLVSLTVSWSFSSTQPVLVNPLTATYVYDGGASTVSIPLFPKFLIPPFQSPIYDDAAHAQSTIDERGSNCIGFFYDSLANPAFSVNSSATTISLHNENGGGSGGASAAMVIGIFAEEPISLTINGSVTGTDCLQPALHSVSLRVTIYDSNYAEVATQGSSGPYPTHSAGFSMSIPTPGIYTISFAIGSTAGANPVLEIDGNFTVSYSGGHEILKIQALYASNFTCPARLNCGL